MKIDLITRVQYSDLYDRMILSATKTCDGNFGNLYEKDDIGQPEIAATYNRLSKQSKADILAFVHDDVEFLEPGWDTKIKDVFAEYKPDIVGVIGSKDYRGGGCFDAGNAVGMFANCEGVKIISPKKSFEPVMVVDGLLMFVERDFLEKQRFDEKFDGLFYYDIDLCLRSNAVGVTSLLVKHSKPQERYGIYPNGMRPREDYDPLMYEKHGMGRPEKKEPPCFLTTMEEFKKNGQTHSYNVFCDRFKQKVPA